MPTLFELDKKDYNPNGDVCHRSLSAALHAIHFLSLGPC